MAFSRIRRLLRTLGLLAGDASPRLALETQIGRRMWLIGDQRVADPEVRRLMRAELRLRAHFYGLERCAGGDPALARQAERLRSGIDDFLGEPRGTLARAVLDWPARAEPAARRLRRALEEAARLRAGAVEVRRASQRSARLRARMEVLERTYAPVLPSAWETWSGGTGSVTVRTLVEVRWLAEDVSAVEELLGQRRARLEEVAAELRARLLDGGEGEDRVTEETEDLEDTVRRLTAAVERLTGQCSSAAAARIDATCGVQLARLGGRWRRQVKEPREAIGSVARAKARWRQLRQAKKRR